MFKKLTKTILLASASAMAFSNQAMSQGSGLAFDGTQNATIVNKSALNLGTGAFTFEAEINASATGSGVQMILSNRQSGSTGVMFGLYGGHLYIQLGGIAPNIGNDKGANLMDGKCHHVAVSRNTSGTLSFYLDGAMYYQSASNLSVTSPGNFYISYDAQDAGDYFTGSIDEIRIWNIERSASDISNNAKSSLNIGAVVPTGLVGFWNLNEGTGQTSADLSKNGANVTLGSTVNVENSDPTWVKVGCVMEIAINHALTFSGSQSVSVAKNAALDLGTGPFTFEANIQAATTGGYVQMILSNRFPSSTGVMFGLYSGHLYIQLGGSAPNIGYNQGVSLLDGKCHHVAITRNASGTLSFYLDGSMYYQSSSTLSVSSSGRYNISYDATDDKDYFTGNIDEIRVWNIERSAKEILNSSNVHLKAAGNTGLVALWCFDEGTGQIAKDSSANNITATLGYTTAVESIDPTWIKADCHPVVTSLESAEASLSEIKEGKVYPNPFEEKLFLPANTQSAILFSSKGEILQTTYDNASQFIQVDENLPSGLYLLKVSTTTGSKLFKLIKK